MPLDFDYIGAKKSGYSDDEIVSFLKTKHGFDFDIVSAKKSGYGDTEISDYIKKWQPKQKTEQPKLGASASASSGVSSQSPSIQEAFGTTDIKQILDRGNQQRNKPDAETEKKLMKWGAQTMEEERTNPEKMAKRQKFRENTLKATENLQKEIAENDDVVSEEIKRMKYQQAGDSFAGTKTDNTSVSIRPPVQDKSIGLQDASPDEIANYKGSIESDATAQRVFLKKIPSYKPEKKAQLEADLYRVDAMNRYQDPEDLRTKKAEENAERIEKGELTYDATSGQLIKPEDPIESLKTGINQRNEQLRDYNFLSNASDEEAIKYFEDKRNSHDPDEPIPIPKNKAAEFGNMFGSELNNIAKGAASNFIPGGKFIKMAIPSAINSKEYYDRGYAGGFEQAYFELTEQGVPSEEAIATARKQAEQEGKLSAAEGVVSTAFGIKMGGNLLKSLNAKTASTVLGAVAKLGGKTIKDVLPDAAAAGGFQYAKNKLAQDKGIDRDSYEGVEENIEGEVLFGASIMGVTGSIDISKKIFKSNLFALSKIPKEATDAKVSELEEQGLITPGQAKETVNKIDEQRAFNAQIPSNLKEESAIKIQDNIKRRDELEKELDTKDKAFHPEIKEKIKVINEEIVELSNDTLPIDKEEQKSLRLIQKALDAGTLQGADANMAQIALQMPGGATMFFENVAEQALNKVAAYATDDVVGMKRAREVYGDEIVDMAIEMFPKEAAGKSVDDEIEKENDGGNSVGVDVKDNPNVKSASEFYDEYGKENPQPIRQSGIKLNKYGAPISENKGLYFKKVRDWNKKANEAYIKHIDEQIEKGEKLSNRQVESIATTYQQADRLPDAEKLLKQYGYERNINGKWQKPDANLESKVKDIEGKAESDNEVDLNEAIQKADEVIEVPYAETHKEQKMTYEEFKQSEIKRLGNRHPANINENQVKKRYEKYLKLETPKAVEQSLKEQTKAEQKTLEQQVSDFGVSEKMVKPVSTMINTMFETAKKAGLTAAKKVGDWVGIGKGTEKSYSLKINGKDVQVKNVSPEVVNGFYSPLEKTLNETKFDKLPAKQWIEKFAMGEEAKWTGLTDWLNQQQGSVSKADIQKYLKENRIQIVEVVKGDRTTTLTKEDFKPTENEIGVVFKGNGYTIEKSDDKSRSQPYDLYYNGEYIQENKSTDDAIDRAIRDSRNRKATPESGVKFQTYQLEGEKENYKEVLVTLPRKELPVYATFDEYLKQKYGMSETGIEYEKNKSGSKYYKEYLTHKNIEDAKFKSSHFDEPNILVHLRMNTRTDAQGNKVLFLEEVQSDWGQKGKKEGGFAEKFKPSEVKAVTEKENSAANQPNLFWYFEVPNNVLQIPKSRYATEQEARNYVLSEKTNRTGGVPSAPFVTDTNAWAKLGLKVALKEAIAQGAKKIAWTTGEQQNSRYDLSKQVDYIQHEDGFGGTKYVDISTPSGLITFQVDKTGKILENKNQQVPESIGKNLADVIGKDVTERILNSDKFKDVKDYYENYWVKEVNPDAPKKYDDLTFNERSVMAEEFKIQKNRKRIEGEGLKVGGKGMKGFYGNPTDGSIGIVGGVAEKLFGQKVGTVEIMQESEKWEVVADGEVVKTFASEKEASRFIDEGEFSGIEMSEDADVYARATGEYTESSTQHSIDITPEMKAEVEGKGQPLFKDAQAQYLIKAGEATIEAIQDFDGSPEAVVALTHEIVHHQVVTIIDGAKEGNATGVRHANTIVEEFNKANPNNKVTFDELIADNEAFKEGKTTDKYRQVQEFVAENWEKYHTEGAKGFSKAFQEVLDAITEAFRAVYKSLTREQITPELRQMFDEILGKEQARESSKPTTNAGEASNVSGAVKEITTIEDLDAELEKIFDGTYDKIIEPGENKPAKEGTAEDYLSKGKAVLNQLFPNVEIKVYETSAEYEAKEGRPKGSAGMFDPVANRIALNLEAIKSKGTENTIFHEVIHPIVNEVIGKNEEALNNLYEGLEKIKDEKGMEAVWKHMNTYFNRGGKIQKVEAVTEFLSLVADGKIDTSKLSKSTIAKIIDWINQAFQSLGINKVISTASDLKSLADSVTKALQEGDTSQLAKTLGTRKEGIAVQKSIADLESKRDAEISKILKPEVKLELVSVDDLVNSKDPVSAKERHTEIKDKYKQIRQLIDCLWLIA